MGGLTRFKTVIVSPNSLIVFQANNHLNMIVSILKGGSDNILAISVDFNSVKAKRLTGSSTIGLYRKNVNGSALYLNNESISSLQIYILASDKEVSIQTSTEDVSTLQAVTIS